jgi:hypothetical protein
VKGRAGQRKCRDQSERADRRRCPTEKSMYLVMKVTLSYIGFHAGKIIISGYKVTIPPLLMLSWISQSKKTR